MSGCRSVSGLAAVCIAVVLCVDHGDRPRSPPSGESNMPPDRSALSFLSRPTPLTLREWFAQWWSSLDCVRQPFAAYPAAS